MRKTLKIIGKIIKWYMIADILCLAFMGTGQLAEEYYKNPEIGKIKCNEIVFEKTINRFKKYFMCC